MEGEYQAEGGEPHLVVQHAPVSKEQKGLVKDGAAQIAGWEFMVNPAVRESRELG